VRAEGGQKVLLRGIPAAWWRIKIQSVDLLLILWPMGTTTAYSPDREVLVIDAADTLQTVRRGVVHFLQEGSIISPVVFLTELVRRVFYEEIGHLQDDLHLRRMASIHEAIVPGSPLETWVRSRQDTSVRNDVLEIAAYFRHFVLADSDRSLREAWQGLRDADDELHRPAAGFVLQQLEGRGIDRKTTLVDMRRAAREVMEENVRLPADGGLLPRLSEDGSSLDEATPLSGLLAQIVRLLTDALAPDSGPTRNHRWLGASA
jgi:hypothetical protein